jgi:hypothetical protein
VYVKWMWFVGWYLFWFCSPLFSVVAVPLGFLPASFSLGVGVWPCPPAFFCLWLLGFLMSFASFVSALPVVGAFAPVSAPPVSFLPASVSLGRAGVVPSSRFLPVASGVVSGLSWDSVRGAVVVSLSSGASFRCLAAGVGGVGSPDAVGLVAALRAARKSGVPVRLVGAPGASGRVASGYFCGITA